MTKLINKRGHVFAQGESIDQIIAELNSSHNDWEYWYRHCGVVDAC